MLEATSHSYSLDNDCPKQPVGTNPCGFCGCDGCFTQLKFPKCKIVSNCPYHYAEMQYAAASRSLTSSPCTNLPIHCSIGSCSTSASKTPTTIWKYNTMFHLASEHSDHDGTLPKIPRELLQSMFITRAEEKALQVTEEQTRVWRDDNEMPNTEGLLEMLEEREKRSRSNTV